MTTILSPVRCDGCGRIVFYDDPTIARDETPYPLAFCGEYCVSRWQWDVLSRELNKIRSLMR